MSTHNNSLADDEDSEPIPTINQRLAQLRPSRELLEYYRKKVAEFDNENEAMIKKLENYKATYEEQHKVEHELTQRENEIADLQRAVSDLQVCILQEREQVLRLYAENDRLKIRDVENQKKVQHLLAIAGPAAAEISYFHKDPPAKIIIPHKLPKPNLPNDENRPVLKPKNRSNRSNTGTRDKVNDSVSESYKTLERDNQTLALQVEALQAQLEEQTKLARDQVNALMDDRQILREEASLAGQRDIDRCHRAEEKLKHTQNMLYESTKDMLQLKQGFRNKEKQWMAEKDHLLQELDALRDHVSVKREDKTKSNIGTSVYLADYEARQQLEAEIKTMNVQLEQAGKLADMYREQCIAAEDELARVKEETDVHKDVFKERTDKMAQRLQLMTQRYEALEKRRSSEVEGFRNDIKLLRNRLKDVEKQLYKVTIGGTVSDVQVLQTVKATAGRSRGIQNELKTLKAKLYALEGDLRGIY